MEKQEGVKINLTQSDLSRKPILLKCPDCKKERYEFGKKVMRICYSCQEIMNEVEE